MPEEDSEQKHRIKGYNDQRCEYCGNFLYPKIIQIDSEQKALAHRPDCAKKEIERLRARSAGPFVDPYPSLGGL